MFLTVPPSYSSIIDIGTLHESEALKSKIRNFAAAVLLSLQQETQLIYEHPWPCQPQRMSRLPCHPPRYDASIRMRTKSYWADPQQPLGRRHPGSEISKIRHWYTLIQKTQEAQQQHSIIDHAAYKYEITLDEEKHVMLWVQSSYRMFCDLLASLWTAIIIAWIKKSIRN